MLRCRKLCDVLFFRTTCTYAAVESMPEDGGNVEKDGLSEQYERYPLVVGNHLSVVVRIAGQRRVPWQIVSVPDPAVVGSVLAVWSGEVLRCPTRDRVAYVLVHTHQNGKDNQKHHLPYWR